MTTTAKNVSKTNRNKKNRSMKGQKGSVGAPRKHLIKPRANSWTLQQMFALNPDVSELTIRNRVTEEVANQTIVTAGVRRKPGKAAGRPEQLYMLASIALKKQNALIPAPVVDATADNVVNNNAPVAGSVVVSA